MRDEKGRAHFGVANGEQDFSVFSDVIRVVEWIERMSVVEAEPQGRPTLRRAVAPATGQASGETKDIQTISQAP